MKTAIALIDANSCHGHLPVLVLPTYLMMAGLVAVKYVSHRMVLLGFIARQM